MKVHVLQIPEEGLFLEGQDPAEILDLKEAEYRPVSPVEYSLHVGASEGGVFATGRVGVTIAMQCVKCLEQFESTIEVPDFACQVETHGKDTVDLTEPMREDILLALPAHPHCDWQGERVCPGAFRTPEVAAKDEPSPEAPDVWGALDQLKIKD